MKKLYATQRASHFKVSRFSFVKALSLAAAATFLSNSSPVYAKSFDIIEQVLQSIEKATAVYSQGKDKTIVSAYDSRSNSHGSHLSKANNLTALNTVKAEKVNVSVAESTNLTEKTLDSEEQYKKSLISSQPFVDNNKDTEVIDVSDFSRNNLITRMPRNAGLPRNTDGTSVVVGNGTIPHINGVDTDVVAVGIDVKVKSVDSVAVGYGSETEKEFSVAVGHLAHSVGKGSIAIGGEGRIIGKPLPPGARTIAGGEESIAIGRRAKTNNMASIAVGSNTQVNGNYAIAFGPQAQVAREDGIAIGHMAHALGKSSTAIGSEYNASGKEDYTTAKGDYSTAVGAISKAFGYGSTAVGHRAYATEKDAVSIGFYSRANTDHAIALGADSIANVAAGVAGYAPSLKGQATSTHFTWKSTYGAVSVGDITNGKTRQIGGVAAGSANTDAVNVAQLKSLQTYVDKGWKLSVDGKNAKVVGIDDTVDFAAGSKNFEITKGEGDNKVKFDLAKDITLNKITLGSNTLDATGFKIANGPQITTDGINAGEKIITAVADGKISPSSKDVINGSQLYTLANSIAATLGSNNVYINENGIFISGAYSSNGVDADGNITKDNYQTVASALEGIGQSFENVLNHFDKKVADVVKTAQDDSLLWSDDAEAFVAKHKKAGDEEGKAKTASKITFLSQGDINATSTDAINGSQLYTLGDNVAKSFGGGAGYKDGKWSAPTFTVKTVNGKGEEEEKTYKNVAAAFEGVGTSFTNVQNKFTKEITNQINNAITNVQGDSLIKKDKETNLITIGKEVSGNEINITNREDKARILSGVKAGTKSTDAVNFAQLKELAKGWKINTASRDFKDAIADGKSSVAIGSGASTSASAPNTIALGVNSQAKVNGGIAIGAYSVADISGAKGGYDPFSDSTTDTISYEWKSTLGAVSFGDNSIMQSRQITGIAAGSEDTDAVNVAQLKYLRKYVDQGWKLSVDGKNAKAVGIDDAVDFAAGSKNFEITKGEGDNKVKFDLAKNITLGSVTTGTNTLDTTGLKITDGPQITTDGIHAGGKKITGVLEATNETDAVNFGQLNKTKQEVQEQIQKQVQEVEKQVAANSFVKQDSVTKHITIGKEVVGDEINIANNMDEARTLSGVKAAVNDNEAVNKKQLEDSLKGLSKDLQSDDSAVVHYDKQEDGTINYASVTFGGKEKTLTALHNIADGAISSESHDAINGGQINKIGEDIAKSLGGNAAFNNGAFTGPTYKLSYVATDGKVTKSSYQGVGTAFAGLDTNIKNVNQRIKEVSEGVAQDSLSWSKDVNAFSAQHGEEEKTNSKIKFLATGDITKDSTEAINGSQLFETNNKVATYLGGGAEYKDGNWTAPSFTLQTFSEDGKKVENKTYNDVGSAFAGIDANFTNVNNHLTNIVEDFNKKVDNINKEVKGDALLWSNEDNAFVAQHEKEGQKTNSKVKFLAAGEISAASTEAINGSQLFETNNKVAAYLGGGAGYKDGSWIDPTFTVKTVTNDGKEENKAYKNVEEAFEGVGTSITNVQNKITNDITNKFNDFTQNITNITQQVQGDALLWSKEANAFVADHGKDDEKKNSKLTHLLDGTISKDSTDAITGKQLYSMNEKFATYFGGGAGYDTEGNWKAPTFKVKTVKKDSNEVEEIAYDNVADAFAGISTSITDVHNEVNNQITSIISDSLVKQDETGLIKIGAEKEGGAINIANKDKADRTLSGVKAAVNDNEAVNKAQLDTNINEVNNNLTNKFNELTENITNVTQHVQGDALLWSNTDKAFSAQHGEGDEKADRKITHLKAGDVTVDSTDAVNGSQLYSLQDQFAKYFGGGAGYDEKGKWSSPVFKVKKFDDSGKATEQEYKTVADAFEGVNQSFTNIHNEVDEKINQVVGDSLVKQDEKTHVISVGGETNGTQVSFANTDGTERVLSGVKEGDLSSKSKEAVNGSQLYSMSNTLASYLGGGAGYDEKGKWSAPVFKVKKFDDSGKATEQEYKTVADAFEGVNQSFTNIHNEVDEKINQVVGESLVKQNEKTHVISVGGETNGTQVSFANSDGIERVLSGVKGGDLSAKSTEAVNGSQLYALGSSVAQYFGGGAGYDKEGNLKAPSFKVKTVKDNGESEEQEYKNVAEALTGVGSSFTNIKNEITNQINHLQSDDSAVVHYDKKEKDEIDYTSVTLGKGKNSTAVGLHNVADGQIANGSHDAITGGQINTIGESIAKFLGGEASFKEGGLTQPTYKLSDVSTEGKVTDKTFTDVGSAFTGLDKNIKNVNDRIKEVSEGVAQDSLLWSNDHNAFVATHGEKKANSRITSLADGNIASGSTDAITGNQLYSLNSMISTYLGGGTKYENGVWTAPDFKVKQFNKDGHPEEQIYHNVADAFAGVSTSITDVHNEVNNQISQVVSDSLVKQAKETDPITIGKEVAGTEVNIANKDREDRTLSGIKAAEKDNEAVNKAQLDQSLEKLSHSLQSDDSAVVLYDKKENGETDYTNVTLGKGQKAAPVALHNVADGQIADKSHDAVTGGQINTISQDVAKFLGGDTSFEKGVFTGPSYKLSSVDTHGQVKSTEFKDVGSAFAGLDTNIKNVNDRIKEVSEGVAQDSLSWSQDDNAFSAQHGEGKDRTASKITHILDGNVTKGSTDAVNGSQLYSMNNTLASYLGGGAEYKEGSWVAPSFTVNTVNTAGDKVEEKSYDSVAAAFEGVGSSFTNLHNEVTNAVTDINNHINNVVSDSLVKQDAESKVIKIGAEKGGTSINIANSGDAARTLTGVKAGSLTEASTDAVNGSQLYSMNNTLAGYLGGGAEYKEGKWAAPSFKVHTVSSDGSKVEEQSYNTVAEAFAGVGSSFTNIHKELKNEINQVVGDSLVKQDEQTHVIAVGGEKSGTEVTFANTDGASRSLTGVKAGALTETSTDAVNGSQLFATNQNVTTVRNDLKTVSENTSKYLGGGADVLKGVAPTYTVQDKSYQSVAEAFSGVDRSFTQLHEEISKNTNEVSENIKQNALLWSESEKAFSAQHGEGKERTSSKITSLANGDITANSTDAVNGSQLYSMNNTLASYFGGGAKFENGQWISPSFKVNTVSADGSKVEEQSYDDVAKAFASVGTSFSNLHNEMTNAVTNINNQISQVVSDNLVKQDATTNLINIGKEVAGSEINIANKDQGDRTLSGVKAAENDNEAVNKAQLDQSLEQLSNSLQSDDSAVVLYDKKENGETDYTSVTLGKGSNAAPVALHNVADGQIAENSHDAVTGGQINTISQDVAKFLGGDTAFKDGTFTGPTYKLSQVDEKGEAHQAEFKDVGSAFTGLDTNIKNVNNHLTNVVQDFTQQITDITEEVKGDALLWSEDKEAFVATHGTDAEKKNSKITSLANGDITANSTDAVNGSQLYSMNNTLASYFGGGAKFENGQWISPSFKVNTVSADGSKVEEQSYDDVAKAFASVGTSFSNLHNELKNEISQVVSDSLVKQDEESKVIKIGAEKEGTEITIANSDGAVRSLSGVKAGTLSADSTEAVNGSQLYSMNQTLASYFGGGAKFENGQWISPSFKILSFNEDGSSEETSYNNVAAAFAGVNQSFTKLHHELSETVEQNALLWSDADESFVALHGKGSEKHNSKLSHLVDGDISAGSTEAITGNQLYHLNQTLAAYLGGGARYQGGQWTAPEFQITQFKSDGSSSESKSYDNVAGAFEGVNGSLSGINDRINNVAENVTSNSLSWNEELGGYDGRHDGKDSKITHVADGDISEGSKEVVNGGQLWETNQKVSAVENRVESIDQHVKDVESAVTNGAVNYDKDADGNKTNKVTLVGGNESDPVLIDNVAEGRIESGSKEAINGGQLHDYTEQQMKIVLEDAKKYTDDHITDIVNNGVSESKAYTDMKFETLNYAVEDVRKEARQAAAIGLAVSNLRYYDIPGSVSVSFGSGLWRSQSAFAVGAGYTSEDGNIRSNVSITSAGGHWGIGAGITLRLR
ncbi:surface protein/Bartonella adhesin [Bartonella kosoyi]|uniref:Surface protein/Bartonella adhesin n=1 Tax=Bartonella kosoyi TaxID=2133959 RepID=A0A5B9CVN1_9HYPH|nr:Vomp family autotransporter [Bartonella kosoyi]QEE08461.1 surface protein/Bartonella adhesin [Bartonella kosoyi]